MAKQAAKRDDYTESYSLVKDVWVYMKERKKFWLIPLIILFAIAGIMLIVGQSSALSPFIYAFF